MGLQLGLLCALILVALASCLVGRYRVSLSDFFATIFPGLVDTAPASDKASLQAVLFHVRIPRVALACMVGAALALSGASYQGVFRNPMVSPDLLGASSGAGLGAAMGILLSLGPGLTQGISFLGGLGAVMLSYSLSLRFARGDESRVLILVLTGMVISSLCGALTSLAKFVADPYAKLPAITFWLMGGLSSASLDDLPRLALPLALGGLPLILVRWRLNLLSFGEEEVKSMGLHPARLRFVVILSSTLLTSAAVSVAGLVGWVGLLIPHLARMLVGPDYRHVLPASLSLGAIFLLLADDVARSLFALEIPLGILTSLVGAPFFIFLMSRTRRDLAL